MFCRWFLAIFKQNCQNMLFGWLTEYPPPVSIISGIFCKFVKTLSLKLFGNMFGNSYIHSLVISVKDSSNILTKIEIFPFSFESFSLTYLKMYRNSKNDWLLAEKSKTPQKYCRVAIQTTFSIKSLLGVKVQNFVFWNISN